MDNASYHSTKILPRKSERKEVLYNFLQKYTTMPGLNIKLPSDMKAIRKFELEDMLEKVARLPEMRDELYTIDKLTKQRGHRVLRLPPYNCDLNPIIKISFA